VAKPLRIGSLFSGIGGLELGLERANLGETVWQVESDPFCRRVLAKHWPNVDRSVVDVREAGRKNLGAVDIVAGGFPCQDVSSAGKGAGLAGARSGLWFEMLRIIDEMRPGLAVIENVASGKRRWLPEVHRGLHLLGYRTRAFALSAADVGAPHLRRRVFVVADTFGQQLREQPRGRSGSDRESAALPRKFGSASVGDAMPERREGAQGRPHQRGPQSPAGGWWASEPDVGRVAYGLFGGVDGRLRRDRLRALGNAVVPQCAEVIGRMIRFEILARG
jgi:DNA (cytosine-5)-methyltransferase 1